MRARTASSTAGGLPSQAGLSPTIPGCSALTRIGASSVASVRTIPVTPPLTVLTVVDPGYGRSLASPPKSRIDACSRIAGSRTWMASV